MRIITANVNGIRSAHKKGFFTWLGRQRADVVCVQETKAQEEQLTDKAFYPRNHHTFYVDAEKKGYSGVALYCRHAPDKVIRGLAEATGEPRWEEFDREARYIEAQFGKLSVVSLYMPSGSSGEVRQAAKYRFMDLFMPYLNKLRRRQREYVICGDWNIAHRNIDIRNWRGNRKNSGFLPEERAWLDELFDKVKYVDAFRAVDPREDQYTWWSNRGAAYEKNVGWRIDYQIVTPGLGGTVRKARIYKDKKFSDHAPLIMDYDHPIG